MYTSFRLGFLTFLLAISLIDSAFSQSSDNEIVVQLTTKLGVDTTISVSDTSIDDPLLDYIAPRYALTLHVTDKVYMCIPMELLRQAELTSDGTHVVTLTNGQQLKGKLIGTVESKDERRYGLSGITKLAVITRPLEKERKQESKELWHLSVSGPVDLKYSVFSPQFVFRYPLEITWVVPTLYTWSEDKTSSFYLKVGDEKILGNLEDFKEISFNGSSMALTSESGVETSGTLTHALRSFSTEELGEEWLLAANLSDPDGIIVAIKEPICSLSKVSKKQEAPKQPTSYDKAVVQLTTKLGIDTTISIGRVYNRVYNVGYLEYISYNGSFGFPLRVTDKVHMCIPMKLLRQVELTSDGTHVVTLTNGQQLKGKLMGVVKSEDERYYDLSNTTKLAVITYSPEEERGQESKKEPKELWHLSVTKPVDLKYSVFNPRFVFLYHEEAAPGLRWSWKDSSESTLFYLRVGDEELPVSLEDFKEISFNGSSVVLTSESGVETNGTLAHRFGRFAEKTEEWFLAANLSDPDSIIIAIKEPICSLSKVSKKQEAPKQPTD